MAASSAFSFLNLRHHHHHELTCSMQLVRKCALRGIIEHDNPQAHSHHSSAHRGIFINCRSLHGSGGEKFDDKAAEWQAWVDLKVRIEAFHGKFPKGDTYKALKALVDRLDVSADPANAQMQLLLGQAKRFLKCPRASLAHYLNLIRSFESSGHSQLGGWYLEAGHACREAGDFEGALHFCSKASETFVESFGLDSLRVAQARSALSKVYMHLARYEDALSESQAARSILKELGSPEDVLSLDLTLADALVHLKKYHEAIAILEEVIKRTTGLIQIHATISIAQAHSALGSNAHARVFCKKASDALVYQEASNQTAGIMVMLASIYEKQEDFEQAALLLSKSIKMYEEHPENSPAGMIAELEGKVGRLLIRIRRPKDALPFLESCLLKKKAINDSLSHERIKNGQELLSAQYYLGAAYSQCQKFQEALEQFEACMHILSKFGRRENSSFAMTIYNNAASMYHFLGRLDKAIECQKAAVAVVKSSKLEETAATKRVEELLEAYLQEAKSQQSNDQLA